MATAADVHPPAAAAPDAPGGGAAPAAPSAADPRAAYALKSPHAARVLDSHMPSDLEADALLVSAAAVERHAHLRDVAAFVKKEMQRLHPGGNRVRADGMRAGHAWQQGRAAVAWGLGRGGSALAGRRCMGMRQWASAPSCNSGCSPCPSLLTGQRFFCPAPARRQWRACTTRLRASPSHVSARARAGVGQPRPQSQDTARSCAQGCMRASPRSSPGTRQRAREPPCPLTSRSAHTHTRARGRCGEP
jgi:hypothetical protein